MVYQGSSRVIMVHIPRIFKVSLVRIASRPITGFQKKPAKDWTAPSAPSSGTLDFNDTQQRSATSVDIDTSPRDAHSGDKDGEVGLPGWPLEVLWISWGFLQRFATKP